MGGRGGGGGVSERVVIGKLRKLRSVVAGENEDLGRGQHVHVQGGKQVDELTPTRIPNGDKYPRKIPWRRICQHPI